MKIELTEKQLQYLIRHFKDTDNGYLALELCISESTLHRFARQYGLTKTKAHCRQMSLEAAAEAKRSHLKNGTYPPKGYIIPGSEKYRFRPGHKEKAVVRRKRIAKSAETRRQTVAEERARIMAGKPQQTKLRLNLHPEENIGRIKRRHYLKKRGYILNEETSVAYYTPDTRRSPRLEARPDFYTFSAQLQ